MRCQTLGAWWSMLLALSSCAATLAADVPTAQPPVAARTDTVVVVAPELRAA
ncbi:MAG: hypothetical protein JNG90_08870, partial [Planctomycetaceae bacterium]|nr:hypothetical protein [Planctomycetaceae bacterium]